MATTHDISNRSAFSDRVDAVLAELAQQGVSRTEIQQRFQASLSAPLVGTPDSVPAEWLNTYFLSNPTAGELTLFASSLDVNSTWLITGDVRFVPDSMKETCLCWETPREYHFVYYGITEPGSAMEFNPDCPKHSK